MSADDSDLAGLEELVVCDLMKEFKMSFDEVCKFGYYSAWRLWNTLDEAKARDLQHLSLIMDNPHAVGDYRERIGNWLSKRQPRRLPEKEQIPKEVLNRFAEAFNRGRK